MSGVWKRTFEIAAPVERVWQAFTDPDELAMIYRRPENTPDVPVAEPGAGIRVLEIDEQRLLRWAQEREDLPEHAEFTVVFESMAHGSKIHVTRSGFGEGRDADIFNESNALGWEHGFMDLVAYLETGQLVKRHYEACNPASTGIVYKQTDAGVVVERVAPDTFGDEAGLEPGDLLVRISGAAVFTRSDMWLIGGLFAAGTALDVEYVRNGALATGKGRLSPLTARTLGE